MRKVTFHEEADVEVNEAARYYEARAPGLGLLFLAAVEEAGFPPTVKPAPEDEQRVLDCWKEYGLEGV